MVQGNSVLIFYEPSLVAIDVENTDYLLLAAASQVQKLNALPRHSLWTPDNSCCLLSRTHILSWRHPETGEGLQPVSVGVDYTLFIHKSPLYVSCCDSFFSLFFSQYETIDQQAKRPFFLHPDKTVSLGFIMSWGPHAPVFLGVTWTAKHWRRLVHSQVFYQLISKLLSRS